MQWSRAATRGANDPGSVGSLWIRNSINDSPYTDSQDNEDDPALN